MPLLKSSIQESDMGLYKRKEKRVEKNGQVSKILKTMGTKMPTIKKEKKRKINIAPALAKSFKFQQERYVLMSIVELG
jgi:hypothetical protein